MSEWVRRIAEVEGVDTIASHEAALIGLRAPVECARQVAQDPYKAKALVAAIMKVGKQAGERAVPSVGDDWKGVNLWNDKYMEDLERHARQSHSIMVMRAWPHCGVPLDRVAISVAGVLNDVLRAESCSYTDIAGVIVESPFLSNFYAAMIGSLASDK